MWGASKKQSPETNTGSGDALFNTFAYWQQGASGPQHFAFGVQHSAPWPAAKATAAPSKLTVNKDKVNIFLNIIIQVLLIYYFLTKMQGL